MAQSTVLQEIKGTASEIIKQVRRIIKEGNARRLMIKDEEGKTLLEVPLTAGVAGTALITAMAPVVSAIGMFAMFLNDVTILVERYPDTEEEKDEYDVTDDVEFIEIEDEEDEDESTGEQKGDADESASDEEED